VKTVEPPDKGRVKGEAPPVATQETPLLFIKAYTAQLGLRAARPLESKTPALDSDLQIICQATEADYREPSLFNQTHSGLDRACIERWIIQ
jgi:hypothetical protein